LSLKRPAAGLQARKRVHLVRSTASSLPLVMSAPPQWKILSAHLVLRKMTEKVSRKCEKDRLRGCQRERLHRREVGSNQRASARERFEKKLSLVGQHEVSVQELQKFCKKSPAAAKL
jgi:hypothetical protein